MGDNLSVFGRDFVLFIADRLAQFMIELVRIDELHLTAALFVLIFGENPHIRLYTRIVKQIGRQCDDCFQQIAFQKPTADLAFPRARIAVKERRAVFDDGRPAVRFVHFIDGRL